jgi:hypothetical protein
VICKYLIFALFREGTGLCIRGIFESFSMSNVRNDSHATALLGACSATAAKVHKTCPPRH